MQSPKRLRVFAGPNGSGKSTLFEAFKKKYNPGYFINSDQIEKLLSDTGLIDLKSIGLKATEKDMISYSKTKEAQSLLKKSFDEGHEIGIELKDNCIIDQSKDTHSYEASFVAGFIRWLHYKLNKSFSFETVMSHPSKIEEIKRAQRKGYKTYLYFVCTDNPEINVNRVADRIEKGGHPVDFSIIRSRYPRTLKNLYPAIKISNRVYLFDNSGKKLKLIAEIYNGVLKLNESSLPQWFVNYVLPNYKL